MPKNVDPNLPQGIELGFLAYNQRPPPKSLEQADARLYVRPKD